jgi:hypothetical protein
VRRILEFCLSQWRHYDPWLEPLCDALGDALVHYDE